MPFRRSGRRGSISVCAMRLPSPPMSVRRCGKAETSAATEVLEGYAHARRTDIATRGTAVNLINRSLLSDFLPIDLGRGLGMAALDLIPPLRRFVMRQGIEPGFERAQVKRKAR